MNSIYKELLSKAITDAHFAASKLWTRISSASALASAFLYSGTQSMYKELLNKDITDTHLLLQTINRISLACHEGKRSASFLAFLGRAPSPKLWRRRRSSTKAAALYKELLNKDITDTHLLLQTINRISLASALASL